MRLLIGFALLGLTALAGALLTAGAGAQQRSLALEERSPSSLTVTWSWDAPPAAFELAWRARGDDEAAAWRTVRKAATDRRHVITELDAGLHYVVRLRGLNAADRPIHDLRGIFATSWSAPRLLRLIAPRDGALTVGWSQPNDWNPRGWRLSWRVAGSQMPGGTIELPAAARSRRIDGLTTATDYLVRLSALNARGGESPAQTIRATASAAALETPRLTALSWSGLTIRAEWQPVPHADGYDLFWRAAEERGGAVGRLSVTGTSAEFDVPAGAYWVELRARVGEGRAARRSDRTQPRNIILLPAPHYLRAQSFDGERARLTWPGADVPAYDLEWGKGGTKQTETRDGRSGLIEVGPLEGGNTYEFRVRARNDLGRSGWSPSATLSPTIWPQLRPLAALDTDGSLYALWPPAAGAEWYEAQWVNAADPSETARVRVGSTPTEGGGIAARIPRDGGFEDGRWLVRVRAGPWGTWSIPHALDLAGQPPRLSLALESSRELCTAGTLTEISWQISGGSAPYALSVENSAVDVSADNVRINCGALTETEAADAETALAAKTITAVVTDSRGVRREAALDVARARALPAPTNVRYWSYVSDVLVYWDPAEGAGSQSPRSVHPVTGNRIQVSGMVRTRAATDKAWTSEVLDAGPRQSGLLLPALPGLRVLSLAAVRHPLETETPEALIWSPELIYAATTEAQNVVINATHDTITMAWDRQPHAHGQEIRVVLTANEAGGTRTRQLWEERGVAGRHQSTFTHVPPATDFTVEVFMLGARGATQPRSYAVRTKPAPAGWTPPPRGAQNLRVVAGSDNIAVSWDPPHPDPWLVWHLKIEDISTGRQVYHTVTLSTTWSKTWTDPWLRLQPAARYRITVLQVDFERIATQILFTMPAVGAAGQADSDPTGGDQQQPLDFLPVWPVRLAEYYTMTDDPFQWRTYTNSGRYHAGLDIGEPSKHSQYPDNDKRDQVDGDPVYAVDAGMMRVFGDDLETKLVSIMYCPEDRLLHEQFHSIDGSASSLWRNGTTFYDGRQDSDDHTYCQSVATPNSGRTALVVHTLRDGTEIMTKYGHLQDNGFPREIALALAIDPDQCERTYPDCDLDSSKSVRVERGQQIAAIGASSDGIETADFDAHVHFEIRNFDIPRKDWTKFRENWYTPTSADNCKSPPKAGQDCRWSGAGSRTMYTVWDVEAYLPPPPASWIPRDPGRGKPEIGPANSDRHVVGVDGAITTRTPAPNMLQVKLSIAFWRPSFYTRHTGQASRAVRGIAGTGPGVTGYWTDVSCGDPVAQNAPNRIYRAGETPTNEGEIPRISRQGWLTLGAPCTAAIYPINDSYPGVAHPLIPDAAIAPPAIPRDDIALRDPSVTLTWVAKLSAGTDVVRSGESLLGDDLDLYTFTARRGNVYKFCTIPSGTSACAPEAEDGAKRAEVNNVAELLIIGPDGEVKSGITRDDSGLEWEVPDNGPANDDYVLIVRRRVHWEGSGDPHAYTLKYTAPPIGVCDTLRLTLGAFLFVCTPPEPIGLSTTTTDNTITATVTPSAGALEIEFKRLPAGANCKTTVPETTATVTVPSSSAASGATGAAASTVSHPFGGLTPATTYKLCARAVRTIEMGFTLHSDWTSTEATTAAAPPDTPDPPACTPDNSTKPSTMQMVTSTKTRWTMSGVYEFKEQRTKSQRQTRSVSWECATSTWTSGAWGDSGDPTYGSWSATGDERCTDPYATKPAEARTEPATEYRWVLRGATAHQQKRTGTAHYSRTVTKTGPRACGWTLGEWGSPDRTSWGTWADTGITEERPADRMRTVSTQVDTEWRVGSSEACEWTQYSDQPQTKRAEWSDMSESWVFGGDEDWVNDGDPSLRWAEPDSCMAKPADKTVTVTERQTRLGPPVFAGTSFCVQYPEKRSRSAYYYQPYVWDASATAWELGKRAERPYSYSAWTPWARTGERPQPCALSALPSGSWSLESGDYELEWSAQRVLFTVPDDASVELSWRARDGGGQEAVFSVAGEGELTVHPDSLDASSGAASGESSERPTLDAIENSLTLVEASAD